MPVPTRLDDWTPEAILGVLRERVGNEGDTYEFKESVNSQSPNYADQIRRAAASLANTAGGFLIFGVRPAGSPEERLVGMEPSSEYSKELSDKIRVIEPALNFTPAFHKLPSGRTLFVAEIPPAAGGPHSCEVNDVQYFWRRGQGRAVAMTHQEIREAFSNHAERLARVRAVYYSLIANYVRVASHASPPTPSINLLPIDTSIPSQYMGEVIHLCPTIAGSLFSVIEIASIMNARSARIQVLSTSLVDQKKAISSEQQVLADNARAARSPFDAVLGALQAQFGFESVPTALGSIPPLPPLPPLTSTGA